MNLGYEHHTQTSYEKFYNHMSLDTASIKQYIILFMYMLSSTALCNSKSYYPLTNKTFRLIKFLLKCSKYPKYKGKINNFNKNL